MNDEIRVTVPMTYGLKDTVDKMALEINRNGKKKEHRFTANSIIRALVQTLPFLDVRTDLVDSEDTLFEMIVNANKKDEHPCHPEGVETGEIYADGPYFKVEEDGVNAIYNYPPRNMPFELSRIITDDHFLDIRRLTQKTVVDLVKLFYKDGPNISIESVLKHYKATKT